MNKKSGLNKHNDVEQEIKDTADWAEDLACYAAENKGRIRKEKLGVRTVIQKEPRSKLWKNENGVESPEHIEEEVFNYYVTDREGNTLLTIQSARNIKSFFSKKRVDKPTSL